MQSNQTTEEARKKAALILKHLRGETNSREEAEMRGWIEESQTNREFMEALESDMSFRSDFEFLANLDVSLAWKELEARTVARSRRLPIFLRYAAVAAFIAGTAIFLQVFRADTPAVVATHAIDTTRHDIPPGGNKAILEFADGSTVTLEDVANGEVRAANGIVISKRDNTLVYEAKGDDIRIGYNKVSTPTGGQFSVVLPDGTHAWLNAESSVRYPTAFTGSTRTVEMTGEVYFEVVRNDSQPFHVKVGDATVEVLGTTFNIMAYDNEPFINTTLVSGAVRVKSEGHISEITPGQQARIGDGIDVVQVNVNEVLAWKNGFFQFNNTSLAGILRQLSRWYGVTVSYDDIPSLHFTGMLSRDNNISEVLSMLELTGGVKFRIDSGRRVIVERVAGADSGSE